MKASVVTIVVRSSTERRLIAEIRPTGIAKAIHITTAPLTRKIVAGSRLKMIERTGSLFWKMLVPKFRGPPSNGVKTPRM
jgi:hypothetical protein